MACRENINGTILVCLGLFVFAASLCHCTSMTRLNVPDKPRDSLRLGQSQAKGSHHRHGRLLIGQYALPNVQLNGTKATKNILHVDTDYQADMGWIETKQPSGQGAMSKPNNAAVERLLKMEPNIECTGDSMNLQVEDAASTPGSLLFVDRGSRLSPIPLSKLPSSCGYSIRSTRKDLVLVAPYDGCFVSLEEDCYVLPLRWCGIPVRMSCPLKGQSSPNPPMVTCHAEGMVVKIESTISASNIKVNLNGNWEPLMKASHRCGFTIIEQSESVVISVGYGPCLEEKDGLYTFELAGDGETKISCPSLQPVHPEFIQNPSNVGQGENGVPKPGATWGQVYQPFHPDHFYRQPKPEIPRATKPTSAPRSPQPEVLQGQVDQPFYSYPFYRQPTPEIPTATHFTADPRPQKPGAPWGQVQQPFYPFYTQPNPEIPQVTKPTVASQPLKPGLPYPFYPQPQPEVPSGTKPIAIPQPQKPEVHQGQVQEPFYHHSFYLQPQPEVLPATKPTSTPQLPESDMPQGHLQQPFCFYPYYPQQQPEIPPTTKPIATPQPQNLEDPQGQVQQPFCIYPSYPQPKPDTKPTAAPWLPQPEVLQGQVDQPFYSYPFHRQPTPEIPTATHFAADPRPQKPGVPQGQEQQPSYPYNLHPQPQPEIPPATKPSAAHQPLKPEVPQGHIQPPFNPYPFYPRPKPVLPQGQVQPFYHQPTAKPTAAPLPPIPPVPEAPHGQVHQLFYPSKIPGAETTEDDSPMDKPPTIKPPQSEIHHPFHQPLNQFYFPQQPQQHVPSMYCPQVCPSGFSNCCIQMAFHQHVHHIIPFGSKDAHQFYPGLPFSQPPDGNLAALPGSNPSETAHPQPPVYHFPYYSHWPYPPQNKENVLQSHSPVLNNRPPGPPAPGYEPMSRETHYELYNLHSTTQGNDWQSAGNMNEQNVPDILSSESISDFLVPYSMLHDAPVPTDNYSEPQPFVSGSKNSQHEKTLNSHSEPTGYVLLHHGPPGREPNTVGDSQMSFGDLAHNSKSVAQNPARLHSNKSQNRVKLLQEKSQSSELKSHNLPGHVDDIQRLDVESDVPWLSPALHGPHSESHESFSAAHLKPKFPESFKDLWKSLKPLGYSQRHQPPVPGKVFQRVSSASDHQANGSKQPPQIEPGPRN